MKRPRLTYIILSLIVLLALIFLYPRPSKNKEIIAIQQAWERVRQSNSYKFSTDVVQSTIPLPIASNIGRQSRQEDMHLEGSLNYTEQTMLLNAWSGDGSLLSGSDGVEVRVNRTGAYVRQPGSDWQQIDDFSQVFAPDGDMMAYLSAAKNVASQGLETRQGITFTRYTFDIDGPEFAAYLRERMEARMSATGELPPGITLDLTRTYSKMSGEGELWIGENGLPMRQIIQLHFPESEDQRVEASIDATFSEFGTGTVQASMGVPWQLHLSEGAMRKLGIIALALSLLVLVVIYRQSKGVYICIVVLVTASMLLSPLLQSAQVIAYYDRQSEQSQQQEQTEQLRQSTKEFTQSLLNGEIGNLPGTENSTINASTYALPGQVNAANLLLEETGEDFDSDGLTDYQEQMLGTDPRSYDTDSDLITDTLEVRGFSYAGQQWYTNPLSYDTNQDGLFDSDEWFTNMVDDTPGDTDIDGVPDLFDLDNDGDDVPDDVDISPYQVSEAVFDRDAPFRLQIDNLEEGLPTYVDFQLRPSNPDHLWYAYNVLDWPKGDLQGQVQDQDGGTYSGAYPAENGDLKLQPMLEIRISGQNHNLPAASTLEDLYGISVNNLVEDGSQVAVYVPLQLTQDNKGQKRVAFSGKMLYSPESSWDTQEVRLVWTVQALVDICQGYNDQNNCNAWGTMNQLQVVQVYYDEWFLTGLRVTVNDGNQVGVLWETPSADDDLDNDMPLYALASALEDTFHAGRVDDLGVRDITIAELMRRFEPSLTDSVTITETWGIAHTSIAAQAFSFSHPDEALASMASTNIFSILNSNFTPLIGEGQVVTPTLFTLSEEQRRIANLDNAGGENTWGWDASNNRQLNIDMTGLGSASSQTAVSMRWQPYCYRSAISAWEMCSIYEYTNELDRRFENLFTDEDAETAVRKRMMLVGYYLALFIGSSNYVSADQLATPFLEPSEKNTDGEIKINLSALLDGGLDIFSVRIAGRMVEETTRDIIDSFGKSGSKMNKTIIGFELLAAGIGATLFFTKQQSDFLQITANTLDVAALGMDNLVEAFKNWRALKRVKMLAQKFSFGRKGLSIKLTKMILKMERIEIPKPSKLGLAIDLVLIWGMFAFQLGMGWGDLSNLEIQMMAADALSATLFAVTFFLLYMFATGVGAVVVVVLEILLGIVEIILLALGLEEYSPTAQIAKFLYSIYPIAEPDVTLQDTDIRPKGSVAPTVSESMMFTSTLKLAGKRKDPSGKALLWPWLWDGDNFLQTAIQASVDTQANTLSAVHGTMNNEWKFVGGSFRPDAVEKYQLESQEIPLIGPGTGINVSLPLYLNVAYDIPVASCWFILVWTYCEVDFTGDQFSDNIGQSIMFDVFPATLDEFYSLNWDDKFPVQRDHDGDGLQAADYGGPDPDDFKTDSDDDGLSDKFELDLRSGGNRAAAPSLVSADTDGDGLRDELEVRLGTLPNLRDSDGDGLNDGEEVYHQVTGTNEWVGGWLYTVNSDLESVEPVSTIVTSDPLVPDTDGDGLNDHAERSLGENPRAWTPSPVTLNAWVDPADYILAPGQSFVYTVTVENLLQNDPPFYISGELQAELPAVLGGETLTDTLTIAQGQATQLSRQISVPDGMTTPGGSAQATLDYTLNGFMHDGDLQTYWTWDELKTLYTETLISHWAGFPPYTSIAAQKPGAPTEAEPYMVATIERPNSADVNAHVNLRQAADGFYDAKDALLSTSPFPRRFLGGYSPGIACNDNGVCLATWERSKYTSLNIMALQLRKLQSKTFFECDGLSPPGEFELQFDNTLYWTQGCWSVVYKTFWDFNTAYPGRDANSFWWDMYYRKIDTASTGVRILYKERDSGHCEDAWWRNDDECTTVTVNWPQDYFDPNHPFYANIYNTHWNVNDDGEIKLDSILFRPYDDGVYGALLDSDGNPLVNQFALAQNTNWWPFTFLGNTDFDVYGPTAVATNGQDFMVAWVSNNGVQSRRVSAAGALGTVVSIASVFGNRDSTAPQVVWIDHAQRYLVAWQDGGVKAALLDQEGNLVLDPFVLTGSLEQPQLDVAVNEASNQALLVYPHGNALKGQWLNVSSENIRVAGSHEIANLGVGEIGISSPAVTYEPFSGGWLVSWLAQDGSGQTMLHTAALDAAGNPLQDKIGLGPDATHTALTQQILVGAAIQQDIACSYQTTDFSHCAITGIQQSGTASQQFLQPIGMDDIPPSQGEVQTSASTTVWVDAQGPSTVIELADGAVYSFEGTVTIGGSAEDPGEVAAGVGYVEISTDGGQSWQPASGGEAWAYNWAVPSNDGPLTLQARAVDKLGNAGGIDSVTFTLDRTSPETLYLAEPVEALIVSAFWDENTLLWRLPLTIQADDTASGVAQVSAAVEPDGSGWLEAFFTADGWVIDYPLTRGDPTGTYSVSLRAIDLAGYSSEVSVPWYVQVDNTSPSINVTSVEMYDSPITGPFNITGVFTDTGDVVSGVGSLQIAMAPAGEALEVWNDVTLDSPGAPISTWSYPLPEPLEGLYQIGLRGADQVGNILEDETLSRNLVEIDTQAPLASCSSSYAGTGSTSQTILEGWAQDFNLLADGFNFACPPGQMQPQYYADPWYQQVFSDTTRLYRLQSACKLNGHEDNPVLIASDRYGHIVQVACASPVQVAAAMDALPTSAILSPLDGTVLATAEPVELQVGTSAIDGLSTITVTANGDTLFTQAWTCPPDGDPTSDASLSIPWDLTGRADGSYQINSQVINCLGEVQVPPDAITVTLDTQFPTITLEPTQLSLDQLLTAGRVVLGGAASDNIGLAAVQVSLDSGNTWQEASFEAGAWRYPWFLGSMDASPDGDIYPGIFVRALDRAGHMSLIEETVTVDINLPEPVSLSISYDAGAGPQVLEKGDIITAPNPSLIIDWTPSSDAGGPLTYLAGWSTSQNPDPGSLTTYADGIYQHSEVWSGGPAALYAHVIVRDLSGNQISVSLGPIFVDSPLTPDYITDLGYHAWMDANCNLIGADGEVSRYADSGATLKDFQKLYATWDDQNLRFTWTGANWESDGDLFIYFDTSPGGSETAYDPYESGPDINLPVAMDADYLVWVRDGLSASLYAWDGSAWTSGMELGSNAYRFEYGNPSITDLLLARSWLGNPTSLSLIALASEEDHLRLWAVIPEYNPLNSQLATSLLGHEYLDLSFALTQAYNWSSLGGGVCPNHDQPAGANLHFRLTSTPAGVNPGYLADGLTALLTPGLPLDSNGDGVPDVSLPLDPQSILVGPGQAIDYSLVYTNTGFTAAQDVLILFTTIGLDGIPTEISIEEILPGDAGSVSIPAIVNLPADAQSVELAASIADSRHGTFEWLWVQHRVDNQPPLNVSIDTPEIYIKSGANLISGNASDPAGIASIEIEASPGSSMLCPGLAAGESMWSCSWNAPSGADQFSVHARATDNFGNTSEWSPTRTWILDTLPPVVALNPASEAALSDGLITVGEKTLSGTITDDHQPASVEICTWTDDDPQTTCALAEIIPEGMPEAARWTASIPLKGNPDDIGHHLTLRGFDAAGNSTTPPQTWSGTVDVLGPDIRMTEKIDQIAQGYPRRMLAGVVSDGSGVDTLNLRLAAPNGNIQVLPITITEDGVWEYSGRFDQLGRYWLTLEAQDEAGNRSQILPVPIQVVDLGLIADLSVELATTPVTAISGQSLTFTALVENAGPGIAPNSLITIQLPPEVNLVDAGGCGVNENTLICMLGDLYPTQDSAVNILVDVPFIVTQTLASTALVSSEMVDLNPVNNQFALNTPVVQPITGLQAASDSPKPVGLPVIMTATLQTGTGVNYQWDFGDGATGEGAVVTHIYEPTQVNTDTYPVVATFTATVTASNVANQAIASTQISLVNSEPIVDTSGLEQIVFEDDLIWSGFIYFEDQNPNDSHTATIDWGDGIISEPEDITSYQNGGRLIGSHTYANPGLYTVTVRVQDAYGGIGTGRFTITVLNGFVRYCAYASRPGSDSGVNIFPNASLDCGWNPEIDIARVSSSGVASRGTILVQAGSIITGTLHSWQNRVLLLEEARLIGGRVERDYDQLTIGNIDAYGYVLMGKDSQIDNNILSRSDVGLAPYAFVGGSVTANGSVTLDATAVVSGTVTQNADLSPIPAITEVSFQLISGGRDIIVEQGAILALDPGMYRRVVVKKGGTLQIRSGHYAFEEINVEQSSQIEFDLKAGIILIDVAKNITIGEDSHMMITSFEGSASDIMFRTTGLVVDLKKGSIALGTYLARYALVMLGQNAHLTGALYGETVSVMQGAHITGMTAPELFATLFYKEEFSLFLPIIVNNSAGAR